MSPIELLLSSLLVAFGFLVGCIGCVIAAKRDHELSVTIIPTALWATVVPLVFLFIWSAGDAIFSHEYSLWRGLLAGVGSVLLFGLSVPIITVVPTVISTVISYLLTRKFCPKRIAEVMDVNRP